MGLGYSTTNISIHLSKLRVDVDTTDLALFDEEITKVQKMFMDVIHFVCSLEGKEAFASGDQNGITSSRDGAVGKQGRTETCKTEKRRSEGISDVIDVETSALQDIGGGSPALLGVTRSKTSEKEARLLPSSEEWFSLSTARMFHMEPRKSQKPFQAQGYSPSFLPKTHVGRSCLVLFFLAFPKLKEGEF